jgi:ribosomal protein S18 acetylase RimI-like enzyme
MSVDLPPPHRWATHTDVPFVVDLVNDASLGVANYLWSITAAPGETAEVVARRYVQGMCRQTIVTDDGAGVIAALIGHRLPDDPQPIPEYTHPMAVPWLELRNDACGFFHVTTLAVCPAYRGIGIGTQLLALVEQRRAATGARGVCLHVPDINIAARRFYERFGFRQTSMRPMAVGDWPRPGRNWLLYTRPSMPQSL